MCKVLSGLLAAVAILVLPAVLVAQETGKPNFDPEKIFARVKEADANQDGKLSKDEIPERMQAHFDKIDADGSGDLDPVEIRAAVCTMMVFARLKAADKYQDGKLCKDEAPERMKEHFDRIDADQSGSLEPEELKTVLETVMKHVLEYGKRLQEADKNEDGKLSKDEAPERMKEHFDRIDANGDGQLCQKELQAAFLAHMKEHSH